MEGRQTDTQTNRQMYVVDRCMEGRTAMDFTDGPKAPAGDKNILQK